MIVSKEQFQLVRDLNYVVGPVAFVMLPTREDILNEAEMKFKQDFNVKMMVSDKDQLVEILSNTPGMLFSEIRPIIPQPSGIVGLHQIRQVESERATQNPRTGTADSVSVVEPFDPNKTFPRPLYQS